MLMKYIMEQLKICLRIAKPIMKRYFPNSCICCKIRKLVAQIDHYETAYQQLTATKDRQQVAKIRHSIVKCFALKFYVSQGLPSVQNIIEKYLPFTTH